MKNLKILVTSLAVVFCQNVTAHAVNQTCAPAHVAHSKYCKLHDDHHHHTHLPVYQNTIAKISLGYHQSMLKGSIELDNGALLHIMDYHTRDDNEMKTWSQGDVLAFHATVNSDKGLVLSAKRPYKYKEQVEPYLMFDVTKESKSALKIAEINEEGKFVKLSDGSVWEFGWFSQFSTKKWDVGQHVLIQGNGEKNSYEFINLSAPISLNATTAKASFVM